MGNCRTVTMPKSAGDGTLMPVTCKKYDGHKRCKKNGTVTMTGFNVYQTNHSNKTRITLCSKCDKDEAVRELHGRVKGKLYNGHAAHTVRAFRDVLEGRAT